MADDVYKIVRYRQNGPNEDIRGGLSLEQAQEHCSREDTHGEGWFDGYTVENPSPELLAEREAQDDRMVKAIGRLRKLGL